jgi:hypothetical protein
MLNYHFSMTRRRIIFEYVHKGAGYLLLALTVVVLCTGLIAADAPRWMPLVLGVRWLMMAGVVASLQRAGSCIDTYQAIWGLDPDLSGQPPPSNRVRYCTPAADEHIAARTGV